MAFSEALFAKMPNVEIIDLDSDPLDSRFLPYAPTEFSEDIVANWTEKEIVGLSHRILQYANTSNYTIPSLEFFVRSGRSAIESEAAIQDLRRWLMSLCYPKEETGAPPRCLFVWPNMVSVTCVINQINFKHSQFRPDGSSSIYTATMKVTEIRDDRISSEDVRIKGAIRSRR